MLARLGGSLKPAAACHAQHLVLACTAAPPSSPLPAGASCAASGVPGVGGASGSQELELEASESLTCTLDAQRM